ncbi:MAG TPA: peptidoglycan-binding protein [Solirubrobacterales bacterium]|nr:peptidoglycan-binding protein [Solirubrobacterales bacterium]
MPAAASAGSADIAALQVAMRAVGLYPHPVDGISGPWTQGAVRTFQTRHGLTADGIAGPQTRRALGKRGKPKLGKRAMHSGQRGWDVAALQFLLHQRGFEPGGFDGGFGPNTQNAVRRFQSAAHISVDGVAGPATLNALRGRQVVTATPGGPVRFFRPVPGPIGDRFGWIPPGRWHTGLDFPEPKGTPIHAGGLGVVSFAGFNTGGYGNLVVISHRLGFESWYAHMSVIAASAGQRVTGGQTIGYVGSTGRSTGPHLHFEVRHFGTPVDPTPYLLGYWAARADARAQGSGGGHKRRARRCRPNADARGRAADPLTARLDRCP